jgi:5'-nucleotidase/UDP-sugar diphosphatase
MGMVRGISSRSLLCRLPSLLRCLWTRFAKVWVWASVPLASVVLMGCGGSDEPTYKPLELNIAHINDHHSQLDAFAATELTLDGVATLVELGGFARQTALFKSVAGTQNLLKIHAGDAVTGSLYYTFFKGAVDAQMMNTVCFDAFTPGNHEFDDGDGVLKGFLDELAKGTCKTSVVSSNVVPAAGSPLAPTGGTPYLKPYVIKEVDGVKVGLIGITIAGKTVNSSRPLATTTFNDEVTSAQKAIDELKAQGIRHIVAITHQGYDADKAMAAKLTDVDVIIGGDSHTLLGDFKAVGITTSSGAYPTVITNKSGEPVCIGQAWEYSKAFGLMNVQFNESGAVKSCGGKATLLIGDQFKRKDAAGAWQTVSDTVRTTLLANLAANQPLVKVVTPDAAAVTTLQTYSRPGECREIQDPLAQRPRPCAWCACLAKAPTAVQAPPVAKPPTRSHAAVMPRRPWPKPSCLPPSGLSLRCKTPVACGCRWPLVSLNMNTAFTLLPFTNVLVEMEVTGKEVVGALEDGVANYLDLAQSNGSHPYAAGLRWDLDMSKAKGQRFTNVQVRDRVTGVWVALDLTKTYVLVTNDFMAAGKDGYTTLGVAYNAGRYVNTYLLYTQSFVDYVLAKGSIARPARADYSHQRVVTAAGAVLP